MQPEHSVLHEEPVTSQAAWWWVQFGGLLCLLLLRLGAEERAGDDDAFAANSGAVHSGCSTSLQRVERRIISYWRRHR